MDFRSVLVVLGNGKKKSKISGIMLNSGYVITMFTSVAAVLDEHSYERMISNCSNPMIQEELKDKLGNLPLIIYYKDHKDNAYKTKRAFFVKYVFSENIWQSTKQIFRFWSDDSTAEKKESFKYIFMFIILKIEDSNNNFQRDINQWFDSLTKEPLNKGQRLRCMSAAFGNENFLDNCSVGIVSNHFGENNSFILSDIPVTPCSDGSPVFCDELCSYPIGIVVSSDNWWKGEWLNICLIADLRHILQDFKQSFESDDPGPEAPISNENSKLLNAIESSLFAVYNGQGWGTGILIDKNKSILITNAHVIDDNCSISIHTKNGMVTCDLLYSPPAEFSLDIAILKAHKSLKSYNSINFSKKKLMYGDTVYAAGFPIFDMEDGIGPTIMKGCISSIRPNVIITTCNLYPGASGGAVVDEEGGLVAVITSTLHCDKSNTVFHKFNMNIPISLLQPSLESYMKSGDIECLKKLSLIDNRGWLIFSKL